MAFKLFVMTGLNGTLRDTGPAGQVERTERVVQQEPKVVEEAV